MKAIAINNSAVTIADNSLAKYIAEWISFADVKPSSQAAYNKALNRFFVYLRNNGIVHPDRVDVINFRDSLLLTCKPSTVQLYLTSVKLFFRFLAANGYYQNVADHVKSVKVDHEHKKDALTVEDSKRVLKQIDRTKPEGKRNVTIIALMMTCGLRSIEVVRANVGDIEKTQGKTFLKVHGKGRDGKVDRVLIPLQVENLINEYLETRADRADDSPLFVSLSNRNKGSRLTTRMISLVTKKSFRAVGLDSPRLTCHSCRHTAATVMLNNGVDIADVQMILRHKNINTTQIYRHDISRMKNTGEATAANAILG